MHIIKRSLSIKIWMRVSGGRVNAYSNCCYRGSNSFISYQSKMKYLCMLVVVSFLVAIGLGMDLNKIVLSIETGIGGQLGHLALVSGFGAMIGKLVSDAGGGYRIAITLINKFGRRKI
ncbi:hypothetical protein DX926_04150 [Bacillus atrophaeus]|nr:hypothetical protein DX926_04150 [Bacillus atrophaeus]